jgi:ATP-dependent DNA helicase HFM1/MER3
MALIHGAKMVTNNTLQAMIPQGLAFHNAGLSMQDRSIVEKLFLDLKIKILCTTSTLSMGINLPARLVIIKSTKCYKGSMKGYQEYSRI